MYDSSAGNRVFGPDNQLCHSRAFFKENKNSESCFRMPEFVKQSTNINSGVDKFDWFVNVNYSSSFTSKAELTFPPNATNVIIIGKPYLDKIVLNENSKIELNLWIQNLELCNGRALIQPPAELLIQADASTKGWGGETCNGVSTGGMQSAHKMKNDLNVLELLAIKLAKRS